MKRETKNQGKGFKDYLGTLPPIDVDLSTEDLLVLVLVLPLPNLESCCASEESLAYFIEC